ncbi:pentatricopeptide repeat-containing protein At2g03380, mitochondrial-like [Chenopodium quinoa]|nr:pentatricopeptide repeat-containing protein At2g03380, mitochondrial-like [Chenopodium quinoa]
MAVLNHLLQIIMNQLSPHFLKQISAFITKYPHQWRAISLSSFPFLHPPPKEYHTSQQTKASLLSISSNPAYLLLGTCKNLSALQKVHALLTVHGVVDNLLCLTKLVSLYGSFGYLRIARKVFDKIPNPDLYSFKVMIRWYFLNELHLETIMCYRCLRKCLRETDDIVFSIVLKACCELRDVNEGRKVHCHIVKAGSPDSFVLTSLVDVYAKCGEIDSARGVFEEIEDRNVVSWTSLITGYVQNDCSEEGLILFNRMRESLVDANQFTLGSLLTGCAKLGALHQGKWLHGYMLKAGINLNSFLATALLDMYVKSGSINDARFVFDEFCSTDDLISWTAMIVGHTQWGQPNEALKLFADKRRARIFPNSLTIASVLSACSQLGDLSMGRSVHCLATLQGLEDVDVKHALIDMYAKCNLMRDSRYIFDSIHNKSVIAWNSIISGYAQNGYAIEALRLFHQMTLESMSPDAVTLVSGISACASISAVKVGSSLHALLIREGLSSVNIYVGTALLNFYAKCGDVICARKVFDEMGVKNEVTWSSMIRGYGMHGDGEESVTLFNNMLKEDVELNDVHVTVLLSACSHTGNVGEGWKYFTSICREHNFVPSMKHYACMVDILARAGKLEEAADIMENMPIRPDITVLGAFVHGCSLHSLFELGEIAARRMLDMHPNEACYYVLLYKLYASDGRWDKADEIRKLMKERGLSKSPGWSSSEMESFNQLPSLQLSSTR